MATAIKNKSRASQLSFRQQLVLTFTIGIVCLAVVSSIGISKISQQLFYNQLLSEGEQLTRSFALQSRLSLLFQSQDSAQEAAGPTLAFPNVGGITILLPDKTVLYQQGTVPPAIEYNDLGPDSSVTHSEDGNAWYFTLPVYAGDSAGASPFAAEEPEVELVGFVQVTVSKESLHHLNSEVLRNNLFISFGLAFVLLLSLLAITNRATRPLNDLSRIMERAEDGEVGIRAELSGPKDVMNMETAFNKMMGELEARQEELKRARDTALASAKVKGEFATIVSHELRTPMNGVMGMLELLQSMNLTDEQAEHVEIARSSGEALLLLIDDILDFSKIESGKLKLHSANFDPREMMKGIVELLSPQANQKKLQLVGEVDDDLATVLIGDSGRIRQILINLVGNAIKFTQQGSIKIHVASLTEDDGGDHAKLNITVEDTGIGIAPSSQQLIFEAFAQADSSTTRQYGGTGLGLAICQQLVKLMGGKIGVHSQLGEGSTFWFTVPVRIAQHAALDIDDWQMHFTGTRVLILSNSPQRCHELIQRFIKLECFHRNTMSASGALQQLRSATTQGKPYDFLVIDTPVDDYDEIKLIEQITADNTISPIRTLLLSDANYDELPKCTRVAKKDANDKQMKAALTALTRDEEPVTEPSDNTRKGQEVAHILVVEDNKPNQLVASGMLKRLGYTCDVAENGNSAITALDKHHYDLVLMDCFMPLMNGYTASQLIRSRESSYQHIPIVALTANTGPVDYNRCFASGMNDYISKPLNLEKLEQKLHYWLNNKDTASAAIKATAPMEPVKENPVQDSSDVESLNRDTLNALRTQIGHAFDKLITTYLHDTPEHLESLSKSIQQADWEKIKYFAHAVKGSSANLGAKRLLYLCQDVEDLCSEQRLDEIRALAKEIMLEFKTVEKLLRSEEIHRHEEVINVAQQPRILIVDDDHSSRIMVQSILERDGYSLSEASNGIEAINKCKEAMPDLIIMDAMMPIMDGFTACKRILSMHSDTPPNILMVTALQDEGTLEKAFAAGATDFILKPINMTVLRQRVSRLLHAGNVHRHIHHLSYYDNLTSLPNRSLFLERCKSLIANAEEHGSKVALLFMDLDRFKLINDTQGHDAGDLLLKTFSQRLESCVRNADIVARLGGDEFAVVLDKIKSTEAAQKVANKIIDSLSGPFTFMQQQLYMSTSIGIAVYPDNGNSINELMKHADTAMFKAKASGGSSYELYEPGMETEITLQIELEAEIRSALEKNEFVLYYQPQVDLGTNEITGCEALIRWQHPRRGLLSPIEFMPFAEKSGLINNIGNWVLNRACQQLRQWIDQGMEPLIPVAVNVSGKELADNVLLEKVGQALSDNNVPPRLLKLEITEDTLVGGDEATAERLRELRNLGVMLAIDDFGTGYSSLSYLKIFPIDTLKIDRSFVRDIPDDANSTAIISGIIALGHSLHLKVVAEGIETEEQRDFLRDKGCDMMQGYWLSKPLPVTELEDWILLHKKNYPYSGDSSSNDQTLPRD